MIKKKKTEHLVVCSCKDKKHKSVDQDATIDDVVLWLKSHAETRIIDNTVFVWPGDEGLGDGLFLVVTLSNNDDNGE